MIHLHSQGGVSGDALWMHRSIGKMFGEVVSFANCNKLSSVKIISYHRLSSAIRIVKSASAAARQGSGGEAASSETVLFMSGLITALRDYGDVSEGEAMRMVRDGISAAEADLRFAGLVAGLGLIGKLRRLTSIDLIGLLSSSHPVVGAASLVALAATFIGEAPVHLVKILAMHMHTDTFRQPEGHPPLGPLNIVAPLALGLALAFTHDASTSSLLLRAICEHAHEEQSPPFDWDAHIIHAGVGLGLVGATLTDDDDDQLAGLHSEEVEALLSVISRADQRQPSGASPVASCAALMALSIAFSGTGNSHVIDALSQVAARHNSRQTMRFTDIVLCHVAIASVQGCPLQRSTGESLDEAIARSVGAMAAGGEDCPVAGLAAPEDLGPAIGRVLGWALLRYSGLSKAPVRAISAEVVASFKGALQAIQRRQRGVVLYYDGRRDRFLFGLCHDLLAYACALAISAPLTCDGTTEAGDGAAKGAAQHEEPITLTLLRVIGETFGDSLDYIFGRSVLNSLSLAFLTLSSEACAPPSRRDDVRSHPKLIFAAMLAAAFPFAGMSPSPSPAPLFSHLLFGMLLGRATHSSNGGTEGLLLLPVVDGLFQWLRLSEDGEISPALARVVSSAVDSFILSWEAPDGVGNDADLLISIVALQAELQRIVSVAHA